MIKTTASLRGNLERDLQKYEEFVKEKALISGAAGMAAVLYEAAREYAPESTEAHMFHGTHKVYGPYYPGTLKKNIYRAYSPRRSDAGRKVYRITWRHKEVPYGFMVEYGTSRAAAVHFLTDAYQHINEAIKEGKLRMKNRLAHYGKAGNSIVVEGSE